MEDRLVDGARRAIERHGWQAATLERIAEESQVSRMTLHRRGVTRDALLEELGARLQAEHREAMYGPLTAQGTGLERLAQALTAICENAESNRALMAALSQSAHGAVYHETDDTGEGVMTRPAFTDALRRLLLDGAADGSLREVDALETATVLMNLVGLTYRHLRDGHGWPPERARGGVIDIALQGVTA